MTISSSKFQDKQWRVYKHLQKPIEIVLTNQHIVEHRLIYIQLIMFLEKINTIV